MSDVNYTREIKRRFGARDELPLNELIAHFGGQGCADADIESLLGLIEQEFGVPAGLLRRTDQLTLLFEPIATKNPLRWLEYKTRAADAKAELNDQLARRLELRRYDGPEITTLGELVRAWCGRL